MTALYKVMDDRDTLIILSVGVLGDVLALRMLRHDLKKAHPGTRLVFALPERYHDAVEDHEDIDLLVSPTQVCPADFPLSYDCSNCCGAYEFKVTPELILNRSDLWATACGIEINDHSMRFQLADHEKIAFLREEIEGAGLILQDL